MRSYAISLKHDTGRFTLEVMADGIDAAIAQVMNAENCPRSAITLVYNNTKKEEK